MSDIVQEARRLADNMDRRSSVPVSNITGSVLLLRQLADIVERLPVTADGVPVYPRMPLWKVGFSGVRAYSGNPGMWNSDIKEYFLQMYSTREAAERSRE